LRAFLPNPTLSAKKRWWGWEESKCANSKEKEKEKEKEKKRKST
jgi:hypothetical protein